MQDEVIFTLAITGEFGVLVSYVLLYIFGVFSVHLSYIKSTLFKKILFLFIILSILSFIYLIRYSSVDNQIEKNRNLLFFAIVLFIFGSFLWSILAAYIEVSNVNSNIQYIALIIVAVAAILILVAVKDEDSDLLLACCSVLIIQHCIIDLLIWPNIHRRGQLSKKLKLANKKLKTN